MSDKASLQDIFDEVESVLGEQPAAARNAKMFLCQKYTGERLRDIGTYFGIGESGVSQACRRVKAKVAKEKKLKIKNTPYKLSGYRIIITLYTPLDASFTRIIKFDHR